MRCASPPESVRAERSKAKYSNPTSTRNPSRLRISLSGSLRMVFCRSDSWGSKSSNHKASDLKSMCPNSAMFLPANLKCKLISLKREPLHSGHVRFFINRCAHRFRGTELPCSAAFSMVAITPSHRTFVGLKPPLPSSVTKVSDPYKS